MFEHLAHEDFDRALRKGLWRKIITWLKGEKNDLLPFDEVRARIPAHGQHHIGVTQVPISSIVGSLGRYRDFDRAFLPRQTHTRDRWVNIDRAHYEEIRLPPVELYKMGEVYFVKDGNHRVSVARERGQEFIDAYVIEIDIPVPLTRDADIDDIVLKGEQAIFLEKTNILKVRPEAKIEMTLPGEYERLLEHINVHRWYLGEQKRTEVPYEEAVASWYDNVYCPVVECIRENNLLPHFPGRSESDLYLWIIEYQWYLREAYKKDYSFLDAARQFRESLPAWPTGKLVNLLIQASWVDNLILKFEADGFWSRTKLKSARPEADIMLTTPGQYDKLLGHIEVHRWYLGEQRNQEVSFEEAAVSWYDNYYKPLTELIRDQHLLDEFPGRTESDLYVWIVEEQAYLKEVYGEEVSIEVAAEKLSEQTHGNSTKKRKGKGKSRVGSD